MTNSIDDARREGEPALYDVLPKIAALREDGVRISRVIMQTELGNKELEVAVFVDKVRRLVRRHGSSSVPRIKWFVYGVNKVLLSRMIDQEPYYITNKQMNYIHKLLQH